jgi:hypothetical protein
VSDDSGLSLIYPPFPRLTWDEPCWTARVILASWQRFQPAYDSDATPRRRRKAADPAELSVSLPEELTDDDVRAVPSPEQAAAFRHLLNAEAEVQAAVLRAVLGAYSDLRESYAFWGDDEVEEEEIRAKLAPFVRHPEEFAGLIGLRAVHILPVAKAGVASVGFEFDCTWDGEHGLGVLTHKRRVIEVGEADTAFEQESAKRDARSRKRVKRKRK